MKNLKLFIFLLSAVFLISACEKIDPPYKETNEGGGGDTTALVRKVLLEDYTGHQCVNCAGAAITSHELKELYKGQLVLMAVHAGPFAEPMPNTLFTADYRTEAGNQWNDYFGVQQYPSGMVNRKEYNGEVVLAKDKWGEAIASLLSESADAKIDIDNSYENGKLTTGIKVKFVHDMSGSYMLQVCITEDSIVSAQKNNDPNAGDVPVIKDFVFMHMLRGAVNGVWGEDIFNGSIEPGKEYSVTYQYNITGVAKNSHVVAFVYKKSDKEIVQVEEAPVIKE